MKKIISILFMLITFAIVPGIIAQDTSAIFDDSELSDNNSMAGWISQQWLRTTQQDFEAGVPGDTSTTWSPGDVLLGVNANWYDTSWKYRRKVTIDRTKVLADLTDFPVLISIPSDEHLASNACSDGYDILFTGSDGVTKLSHELEKYDSVTGQLVAWVKVPSLSSSFNTEICIYYGNVDAANQQNVADVWSNGYQSVYHLNNSFADSKGSYNGTNSGSLDATGVMAQGREFNPDDGADYIGIGTRSVSGTGLTIQSWSKFDDFDVADGRIISKDSGTSTQNHVWTLATASVSPDYRLQFLLKTGTNNTKDTSVLTASSGNLSAGTWYLTSATYDGSNMKIYLNGTEVGSTSKTGDIRVNNYAVRMGNSSDNTRPIDGILDEVRISSVARTPQWLQTEYNNQSSPPTFYSIDGVEGRFTWATTQTIASQVLDTSTAGGRWDGLGWHETLASGTDITFEVRASDTLFAKDASSPAWVPVTGTSPIISGLPSGEYKQWRVTLSTADGVETPVLHDVTIYYYYSP